MYADDLIFFSRQLTKIQDAMDRLSKWTDENGLHINEKKTKIMKFRRGGKLKSTDILTYKGTTIDFTNEIEYLGLTLQPTWTFSRHLQKKLTKTAAATHMTRNLDQLSIEGALRFFRTMIEPIMTYGLPAIWNDLTTKQMEMIDKCKTTFMKRVLRLPRNASNRMTLILTGTTTLTEDLTKKGFPMTDAYNDLIDDLQERIDQLDHDFYDNQAFKFDDWKGPRRPRRHLTTRAAIHGFHHRLCSLENCFDPDDDCICRYCDRPCFKMTHYMECDDRPSLAKLDCDE